eukprot:TRINITY_DN1277_c0_g2_i3.p1 TRINITY_DN1277_c0_g2~~TRINITY_DN1277_c0_g2_i3.p1  ORF type:complete len:210 (+),score=36.01 TRINITY_DN1277_c0_g2_i3:166-795(+)
MTHMKRIVFVLFALFSFVSLSFSQGQGGTTGTPPPQSTTGVSTTGSQSTTGTTGTSWGTTGNTSFTTTTGGSNAAPLQCTNYTSCSDCISSTSCVWCGDAVACVDGSFYGGSGVCGDFRWKQCHVDGKYLMVAVLGAVGIVLLCFLICICRCMCRQSRKTKKATKLDVLGEEERTGLLNEEAPSRHPHTDRRREELRAKWGISSGKTIN